MHQQQPHKGPGGGGGHKASVPATTKSTCRAAGQAAVTALVRCLEARREEPCPDTNDLALNALDCLHKLAPRLQLAPLSQQRLSQLMSELCQGMAARDTPLRVRAAAAGVIQRLALETQNLALLASAAGLAHVSARLSLIFLVCHLCVTSGHVQSLVLGWR